MKKALIAMLIMFLLIVAPFGGVWSMFSYMTGGGVSESFIYPIYAGLIINVGVMVGCTSYILREIKRFREEIGNEE